MSFVARAASIAAVFLSCGTLAFQASTALAAEVSAPALPAVQPVTEVTTVPAVTPAIAVIPTEPALAASTAPDGDVTDSDDEQVAYPTLAAAIAAQDRSEPSDEALRCLAGAVYYESRGEPLAGQLAVAEVVLNRAASGRFGSNVCRVITQPGQFSFVRGGRVPTPARRNADWTTAIAVAKVAMTEAWESTASKALYFHARRISTAFARPRLATIGNHVFYR